jgi:hypothetical protein
LLLVLVALVVAEGGFVVVGGVVCVYGGRAGGGVWVGVVGFFGKGEEVAVADPCGDGGGLRGGGIGGVEFDGAEGLAGVLDGVDVAGLESEGDGLGEVDAGVFEMVVDEE